MLVTYGRFGVYATAALIVNALLILGIMAIFNATLTLPGIAGFVLTIGAAVDANVLINERIREEQRRGRKILDALETGYKEASTAIFDANITNVIAAALDVLFRLGADPRLRGRADDRHRHLGVHGGQFHPDAGRLLGQAQAPARAAYLTGPAHEAAETRSRQHQHRLHARGATSRWSCRSSRPSPAWSLVGVRGFNLGVDFVGGQMVRTTFAQPVDVEQLRGRVGGLGLGEASIQEFGGPRTYQIRLPRPEGGEAAANRAASQVRAMLTAQYPGRADRCRSKPCRARSARSWRPTARWRSSWRCSGSRSTSGSGSNGSSASARWSTLFHDVSMIFGFFAITQLQVDLNIVAAFLAVVGYSLNDTVVIYDRIRENLRKYRKMAIVPLLNLSLNETLSRTIVTSLSIMLALAVLLVLGPDVIFGLTLAILLGTFIGTYSSIYISAPILVWLGVNPESFLTAEEAKAGQSDAATAVHPAFWRLV